MKPLWISRAKLILVAPLVVLIVILMETVEALAHLWDEAKLTWSEMGKLWRGDE